MAIDTIASAINVYWKLFMLAVSVFGPRLKTEETNETHCRACYWVLVPAPDTGSAFIVFKQFPEAS